MVQAVFHASQPLFDRLVGDFELRGRDAAVVVFESDAVFAPDERRAFDAATCGDLGAAFARFGGFAGFGGEPVEGGLGGGEGAGLGLGLGAEGF